jgi:hypothetical protein
MLGFWIFHKMDVLIKIIKLILLIANLYSKGLERNIKDVCAKKRHLMFLIGFWHSK